MGMFGSIAKEGLLEDLITKVERLPIDPYSEGEIVKQQILRLLKSELRAVEFD